jgi:hypothetical protein
MTTPKKKRRKSHKVSLNYDFSFNVSIKRERMPLFDGCCKKLGYSRAEILRMMIEQFIEEHR